MAIFVDLGSMTPPVTPNSHPEELAVRAAPLSISTDHASSAASTTAAFHAIPMASSDAGAPTKPGSSIASYTRTAEDGALENTTPYSLLNDAPIGEGLWSSVYLASPIFPSSPTMSTASTTDFTPPATPVSRHRQSSTSSIESYRIKMGMGSSSRVWAVKVPVNKTAKAVIRSEAQIMTRISSCPGHEDHVVPFIGLNPQNGGLMMQALPLTLEDLVQRDLESLDGPSNPKSGPSPRAQAVASLFPKLATCLLESLEWLHSTAGIIHADIKPANILLRPTAPSLGDDMLLDRAHADPRSRAKHLPTLLIPSSASAPASPPQIHPFTPIYADFSAAFPVPTTTTQTLPSPAAAPPQTLAGGTWDFLAPELCRLSPTPTPTPSSDLYALGITLLFVVLGGSPFAGAGNVFRKREMVKMGDAVGCAGQDYALWRRFCEVKGLVREGRGGWDLEKWLRRGLRRKAEERAGVGEWKAEVGGGAVAGL